MTNLFGINKSAFCHIPVAVSDYWLIIGSEKANAVE